MPDRLGISVPQWNELIERLVQEAISALHHDGTEGNEVDKYERHMLRCRFAKVLRSVLAP